MFNTNTELTAECIKSLADNNRCISCDKLNTPCVRYPCGHAVCAECVSVAECCVLCITPPPKITHYEDELLSQRVENASQLVSAYRELFGEDVEKRVRISKQQKLEKLLFPECIQVNNKYFNKRKSSTSISNSKENVKKPVLLPGEEVTSTSLKMENKNTYVQDWINNIQSPKKVRKPFEDISVNCSVTKKSNAEEVQTEQNGKRIHFETTTNDSENVPVKKSKRDSSLNKSHQRNKEADESGIVMDDDIIEIDVSHEVDKDKLACAAVEEAELSKDDVCMDLYNDSSYVEQALPEVCETPKKTTKTHNVPFYKKSYLHKTCEDHQACCSNQQRNTSFENMSITIENKSFLTMINVSNSEEQSEADVGNKKSKHIIKNESHDSDKNNEKVPNEALQAVDIVNIKDCANENVKVKNESNARNNNEKKGVIISDSDSDSILSCFDNQTEVVVGVDSVSNRTDLNDPVLSELNRSQYENRAQHAQRESTPLSTNSSEKENYDPNRMKRKEKGKKSKKIIQEIQDLESANIYYPDQCI